MFDLQTYTLFHVIISLVGIFSGLVVAGGLMANARFDRWTAIFLFTTVLTSVTGFGFPFTTVLPSHVVGGVSLVVLLVAVIARYLKNMTGGWRWIYVASAIAALWLNAFVLLAQLFVRVPALNALGPTPKDPAFALTQLFVLLFFIVIWRLAARGFRV